MFHEHLYNVSTGLPKNNYLYVASLGNSKQSFEVPVKVLFKGEIQTKALIDSGAFSCFINSKWILEKKLIPMRLNHEIKVFNADASENKQGMITHYIKLPIRIGDHTHTQTFLITNIGKQDIILGMSFLKFHNPEFDWKTGILEFTRCPSTCYIHKSVDEEEELRESAVDLALPQMEGIFVSICALA